MLNINITYDGDIVKVSQIDADTGELLKFIEVWSAVAEEPCIHGHKCEVIKRMLLELKGILGG